MARYTIQVDISDETGAVSGLVTEERTGCERQYGPVYWAGDDFEGDDLPETALIYDDRDTAIGELITEIRDTFDSVGQEDSAQESIEEELADDLPDGDEESDELPDAE